MAQHHFRAASLGAEARAHGRIEEIEGPSNWQIHMQGMWAGHVVGRTCCEQTMSSATRDVEGSARMG